MRKLLGAALMIAVCPVCALAQTVPAQGKAEVGPPDDGLREMATDREQPPPGGPDG